MEYQCYYMSQQGKTMDLRLLTLELSYPFSVIYVPSFIHNFMSLVPQEVRGKRSRDRWTDLVLRWHDLTRTDLCQDQNLFLVYGYYCTPGIQTPIPNNRIANKPELPSCHLIDLCDISRQPLYTDVYGSVQLYEDTRQKHNGRFVSPYNLHLLQASDRRILDRLLGFLGSFRIRNSRHEQWAWPSIEQTFPSNEKEDEKENEIENPWQLWSIREKVLAFFVCLAGHRVLHWCLAPCTTTRTQRWSRPKPWTCMIVSMPVIITAMMIRSMGSRWWRGGGEPWGWDDKWCPQLNKGAGGIVGGPTSMDGVNVTEFEFLRAVVVV